MTHSRKRQEPHRQTVIYNSNQFPVQPMGSTSDKDGRPRLMRVTKLRSKGQKEGGKQMEIKFEDER